MNLKIINKRKYFYIISGILFVVSILSFISWGLKLGIDFTGGSLLEVDYVADRPAIEAIRTDLADLNLEGLNIQPIGDKGFMMRFKEVTEEKHQQILDKLNGKSTANEGKVTVEGPADATVSVDTTTATSTDKIIEKRFESIGPSIGKELKTKAFYAIILASIGIIIYIAIAFRKVSFPVASWKYGTTAVIALLHDIVITTGIFVFLGHFLNIEVNAPFIAALLTIIGYSVNDTIVVFDRTRENLHKYEGDFEEIVDQSIRETLGRSINTLVTVELALFALLVFGGATITDFVLALTIGILFGGYSSIFVATALLVSWHRFDEKLKS